MEESAFLEKAPLLLLQRYGHGFEKQWGGNQPQGSWEKDTGDLDMASDVDSLCEDVPTVKVSPAR